MEGSPPAVPGDSPTPAPEPAPEPEPAPFVTEIAGLAAGYAENLEPERFREILAKSLIALYQARTDQPVWSSKLKPKDFAASLSRFAEAHGFPPTSSAAASIHALLQPGEETSASRLDTDARMTAALLQTGLLIRQGAVSEKRFWGKWEHGKQSGEDGSALEQVLQTLKTSGIAEADPAPLLEPFVPANPVYQHFLTAKKDLEKRIGDASEAEWPVLPPITKGKPIREGDVYEAVGQLEARLKLDGYWTDPPALVATPVKVELPSLETDAPALPSPETSAEVASLDAAATVPSPTPPPRYTSKHADAVERFQEDHGLASDGVIGPDTIAVLNKTPEETLRTLRVNLERARWLPDDLGRPRFIVNIPAGQLFAYDVAKADISDADSSPPEPDMTMRIIYGSAIKNRQTPIFHDKLEYIVFRPYWNIPNSILRNEILPKVLDDRKYLVRNGYQIVDSFSPNAAVYRPNRRAIKAVEEGNLKIRQQGGPGNALGLVKFVFPNENNVYLHDTPEHHLFQRSERDFSHGCVRVEKPAELAEFILGRQGWSAERVKGAMYGNRWQSVGVDTKINIYIVYFTTSFTGDPANPLILHDVYHRDGEFMTALEEAKVLSIQDKTVEAEEGTASL